MATAARISATLFLALVAVLAYGSPAQAYVIGGARWPGNPARITYYDSTPASYRWSIEQAAKAWNTSGVHVRFVKVSSRSRAQVTIRVGSNLGSGSGFATIGYASHATIDLSLGTADQYVLAGVAAHEMGHILGLDHPSHGCAVMTPVTYGNCKPVWPPHFWQWRCRVLQQDDLNGAAELYGGRPKLRPSMWCEKGPKAKAVTSLTVTPLKSDPGQIAKVSVTFPKTRVSSVVIDRRAGKCPTGPRDFKADPVGVVAGKPGTTASLTDDTPLPLTPGTYCYRAYSYDEWNRAGNSRTAKFDYTGPPAVPVSNVLAVAQNTNPRPGAGGDPVLLDVTVTTPTMAWLDSADVRMKQGSCPTDASDGQDLGEVALGVGVHLHYGVPAPAAGSWCVAAFTFDGARRYAAAGATLTFDYTPPTSDPPTNVQVQNIAGDVTLTWDWPNPLPFSSVIARFDGPCTGTLTLQDVFTNAWDYPDPAHPGTWTDYTPDPGTYCAALVSEDSWGYYSPVVETEYTVP